MIMFRQNFYYLFGHLNELYTQPGTDPRTALRLEMCQSVVVVLYVRQMLSVSQESGGSRYRALRSLKINSFLQTSVMPAMYNNLLEIARLWHV